MASMEPARQIPNRAEELPPSQERKRKRLATVCLSCKTRKLKCDKEFPACSRCKKSGKPEYCMYEEAAIREMRNSGGESNSQVTVTFDPNIGRHYFHKPVSHTEGLDTSKTTTLEDRLKLLERLVMQQSQFQAPLLQGAAQHNITARLPDPALIISSLVAAFKGLATMTNDLRKNTPRLVKLIHDLGAVKRIKPANILDPNITVDRAFLGGLIPARGVVEELVEIYLDCVESMYRLTHLPTFRKQMQQYWDSEDHAPTELIVQLLLMMATVWLMRYSEVPLPVPLDDGIDRGPQASSHRAPNHLQVGYWILCCEEWIRRNKMQHVDLNTLRLLAHVVIAKDANRIRYKHEWSSTGMLVKLAMSLSIHRELEPLTGFLPFGQKWAPRSIHSREIRRRLWATILELDLKASLDKGMPPTVQERDFDSPGPLNINDHDCDEDTTAQPMSQPHDQPTDAALQHQLYKSLSLRLRTCALVYSPRLLTSYSELAQIDNDLGRALVDIPEWDQPFSNSYSNWADGTVKQGRVWRGVMKYKIRHAMLSLHNRLVLMGGNHCVFPTSRQLRVDIAADILLQHMSNNECFRTLNVLASLDCYGQAALTVCHHLHTTESGLAFLLGQHLAPELSTSLLDMAEKLLGELESKAVLLGKGHKEFLLIATVIALTRIKMKPESKETVKQQLVERLLSLGYRMLERLKSAEPSAIQTPSPLSDNADPAIQQSDVFTGIDHGISNDYANFAAVFIPDEDGTLSGWNWDFLPGQWVSTDFFAV